MATKKANTKTLAVVKKAALKGVKQSAAQKKRLESLLETIERRKARIVEDFYDIGVALKEILEKKLYLQAGYASFGELIDARKIMGKSQAFKLVSIARSVSREKAFEVGSEKAYELVRVTEETPGPDTVDGTRWRSLCRTTIASSTRLHFATFSSGSQPRASCARRRRSRGARAIRDGLASRPVAVGAGAHLLVGCGVRRAVGGC